MGCYVTPTQFRLDSPGLLWKRQVWQHAFGRMVADWLRRSQEHHLLPLTLTQASSFQSLWRSWGSQQNLHKQNKGCSSIRDWFFDPRCSIFTYNQKFQPNPLDPKTMKNEVFAPPEYGLKVINPKNSGGWIFQSHGALMLMRWMRHTTPVLQSSSLPMWRIACYLWRVVNDTPWCCGSNWMQQVAGEGREGPTCVTRGSMARWFEYWRSKHGET